MNREDPRGAQTRTRLVTVARELIAEGGLGAATTRAITQRAGANVGAVNYHFGSKSALLREAVASAVAAFEQSVASEEPSDRGSEGSRLLDAVRAARPLADDPAARVILVAALEGSRDPDLADLVRAKLDALRTQILQEIGGDPADSGLAMLIAASLDGLLLHVLIDPETNIEDYADALQRVLALADPHKGGK